ncbi:MAG TPA: hypothetical protein VIM73_17245 [Polyangiaceae bacterium]
MLGGTERAASQRSFEERPFADLVFHVLAHVESAVPASVYDPEYVAFAARHLGSADARSLSADVAVLKAAAREHESYARLQGLAWLFGDAEQASRVATRDFSALTEQDVASPAVLRSLAHVEPALLEVLRCAIELERPAHAKLPPLTLDREELGALIHAVGAAAPRLSACRVALVRALGRRGRVLGHEIWVGAPWDGGGPTLAHLSWQAAHEATVLELATDSELSFSSDRALEAFAIVLLGLRARRAGLAREHELWFAHFQGRAGAVDPARLNAVERARLEALLAD